MLQAITTHESTPQYYCTNADEHSQDLSFTTPANGSRRFIRVPRAPPPCPYITMETNHLGGGLVVWLQLAAAHTIVKFLPGFKGALPFHLETGYVGVDEAEDVQLFFYFIKSQRNSKDDPLLLWLTGGPGCSAFCGLVFEIGPISFEVKEYNGSLPTLVFNPYSWTQVSSIIFLDLPVRTGFSYARTPLALQRSDFKQVSLSQCISDIEDSHILERKCPSDDPRLIETLGKRRYLRENPQELVHFKPDLPTIGCRTYGHVLVTYWANDDNVRKALHVREGSIEEWKRCNYKLPYTYEIKSSINGDHDMEAPFLGTQAWIRSLNYSIVDDWQPWHYQGQVAGYTRTYSSQLTFATVKVDNSRTFVTRLRPKALSWEMVTGHCICQAPFL
ncbi:hypothetical protein Peur_028374 [Populus x canadensis]